jgi:phage tail sheath protein FI
MGRQAQRRMVVTAMRGAISASTEVREERFAFTLITAPGYPELISDMVSLNNDRRNTAFVIGDTPMNLPANIVQLTNYSNGIAGTYGDGLTTADPYLAVFYPACATTDVQGNEIVMPASHMALRTFIRSDNVSYQWFAPAGVRRGLIDNATNLGYLSASGSTTEFIQTGVNQSLRDAMYPININPLTILPGVGLVCFGQKTRNPTASSLDRINVARLVNYIRTILANVGNGFLFEPNDKITRDQLKQIIEGAMNDLVAKRGIYDYLVVCDTSNNTPARIARNELYVDIAIEPMKDVEFIYIPIRLKNPGDIAAGI